MAIIVDTETKSLCPECVKENKTDFIPAKIFEENGKIFIEKECGKHGKTKEIYWSDADFYKKSMKFLATGSGVSNPAVCSENCPNDCGLCALHKSSTLLANIDVTNRCNLKCWYCFANAAAAGYIYEPSFEEIEKMLATLRQEKPVPCVAVQFSGGEPLIRKDIIDIVRSAKRLGFRQVQIATNGIEIAKNPLLAQQLRDAGLSTIYLKWNGVSEKTNIENLRYKEQILDACRKAKLGIVLVPAIIGGYNDHEIGAIIKFATDNIDIIRGVNFQPISFVGRIENIKEDERLKQRITIPDLVDAAARQTSFLEQEDFYPITTVLPISHFVEALKGKKQIEFTAHPACGLASYLFVDNKEIIPVTRFVKVDGLMQFIEKKSVEFKEGGKITKIKVGIDFLKELGNFFEMKKAPKGFDIPKMIFDVLTKRSYKTLKEFHHRSLFIGMMHFQDAWNMDFERLKRCVIHYVTPDMRIIPFCAYNCLPQYREATEKKFSQPIEQWQKQNPGKAIGSIA